MKVYKLFLKDLVFLLKEDLEDAKKSQDLAEGDYDLGISMGIYCCLDLIKQKAESFNIPLSEIGLKDYHLDFFVKGNK